MDVVAWLESRVMRISWLLMDRSALPMMPARRGCKVQDTLCMPQCVKEFDKRKSANEYVPAHTTNTAKLEGGHWVHSQRRLSLAGPGSKLLLPGQVIQHPANGDGLHAPSGLQGDGVRIFFGVRGPLSRPPGEVDHSIALRDGAHRHPESIVPLSL